MMLPYSFSQLHSVPQNRCIIKYLGIHNFKSNLITPLLKIFSV